MPLSQLLNLFFPSRCPLCFNNSDAFQFSPICSFCWAGIDKYIGPACKICGIPSISEQTSICGECLKTKQPFSRIIYYGLYDSSLKKAIHLLKFRGIKRLAKPLSRLLLELPIPESDLIIPVPLHLKKLREREFNQTALIGSWLSKELNIPIKIDNLFKIKETPPQTMLRRKERLENMKNAFFATGVMNADILLIDDVITSGATVRECSKSLMQKGAKSVTVLALAHSRPTDLKAEVSINPNIPEFSINQGKVSAE